ncbi:hypothetical protein HanXRQr2_Chr07g0315601 [Helianthus annuus]|uniref:Uncharacterized protein n=1 Tax=Helianthus annuus TaxID=4232 RepID=A0A9K3IPY4_HELAN|nr:hypothetical protein HanXRQr2_Chr07g0315601 [Helianthus annuus]
MRVLDLQTRLSSHISPINKTTSIVYKTEKKLKKIKTRVIYLVQVKSQILDPLIKNTLSLNLDFVATEKVVKNCKNIELGMQKVKEIKQSLCYW